MQEFIEELKQNADINKHENIENRIDIDYVIERLEDINAYLLENAEYFKNDNKGLNRQQLLRLLNIIDSLQSKGVFKYGNKK